jgi:hypothetical protein
MTDPRRLYPLEGSERDVYGDYHRRERRHQQAVRCRVWAGLVFWSAILLAGVAGAWIIASLIITTPPMECLSC